MMRIDILPAMNGEESSINRNSEPKPVLHSLLYETMPRLVICTDLPFSGESVSRVFTDSLKSDGFIAPSRALLSDSTVRDIPSTEDSHPLAVL
jgi:hypothetical protein